MNKVNWINCVTPGDNFANFPPCDEGNGQYLRSWNRSIEVLFTDGNECYIGNMNLEIDEDWYSEVVHNAIWSTGRSGWNIEDVTHWAFLPELPNKEVK